MFFLSPTLFLANLIYLKAIDNDVVPYNAAIISH